MHKVFVFGTLKEGFPNFKTNKGVRYKSIFQTKDCFRLYLVGDRFSPWLILHEGEGHRINGQVFDVSNDAFSEMDALERTSKPDGYRRVSIQVVCRDSGEELSVFVYGKPQSMLGGADVRSELEGEYSLEHAKLYRSRSS